MRENRVRSWWNLPSDSWSNLHRKAAVLPSALHLDHIHGEIHLVHLEGAPMGFYRSASLDQFHHFLFSKAKWKTSAQFLFGSTSCHCFSPSLMRYQVGSLWERFFFHDHVGILHGMQIPSGKRLHNWWENHHVAWENYKWWFSIVMLVYQRDPDIQRVSFEWVQPHQQYTKVCNTRLMVQVRYSQLGEAQICELLHLDSIFDSWTLFLPVYLLRCTPALLFSDLWN